MKSHFFYCGFALVLTAMLAAADTINIDFTGIPDGTPLSSNNPYGGGIVNLWAESGYDYGLPEPTPWGGYVQGQVWAESGSIQGGIVLVDEAPITIIPPTGWSMKSMTSLTATFLAPVSELSFTTHAIGWWVNYDYRGTDGNGNPFSDYGSAPLPGQSNEGWQTTVLQAPDGGYFTQLHLSNWEDVGGGAFLLQFMSITVPEGSALAEKAFLLFLLAAAPLVRHSKWSGSAVTR
jgi:hypothetical protein